MSQENKDKADAAESRTQQTKGFIQQVRVASRRKYTPEEKIRIVLEGFRREVAVNELCRREGIKLEKEPNSPNWNWYEFPSFKYRIPRNNILVIIPSSGQH